MISAARGRQFVHYVLPAVLRPLRVAWNQLIGLVFLILGFGATPRVVRSLREYNGGAESLFRVLLSGIFVVAMSGFGIHSFLRARKAAREIR